MCASGVGNAAETLKAVADGRAGRVEAALGETGDRRRTFEPIFWEGSGGEIIASDWAGGFLDAVALRPQAWKPLMEDDRAGVLMAPLFLLNGDVEIADGAADENEVLADAADMIPTCAAGIYEFWQEYQKPLSSQGRSRRRDRSRQ